MKSTELMIGDWVSVEDLIRCRVDKIFQDYVVCLDKRDNEIIGNIMPIPLTPEMLERNGWIMRAIRDAKWIAVYEGKGYPDIWEDIDGNLTITIGFDADAQVSSVHQLQHILRLCGLNELADNFKI